MLSLSQIHFENNYLLERNAMRKKQKHTSHKHGTLNIYNKYNYDTISNQLPIIDE